MKMNQRIMNEFGKAEAQRRCLHLSDHNSQQTLRKLVESGEVTRTRHGLYAQTSTWKSLNPNEHYLWIIRGLHEWYPDWIFAGISAISTYNLEYPSWLHRNNLVFLASQQFIGNQPDNITQYIHVSNIEDYRASHSCVTSVSRAIVDCAMRYQFHEVLPIVDSALRQHQASTDTIRQVASEIRGCKQALLPLLHYADAKSENGGESLCRAVMLEQGFATPELQREFNISDAYGSHTYRVDMAYPRYDGSIVAVEFDGLDKYVDPAMTRKRDIRQVVHEEKERERNLLSSTPITQIVRLDYPEVMQRDPLVRKLTEAGVPRTYEWQNTNRMS
ncbi:hypothetical protein OZX72_02120 [Bifidobacterium sp. ESL0769]|uniref:hypothetical protein n=1 Tax=Bifidobacterium sp. ESL0769 TaxID=2983229 RepID=UPI0023F91765|nr:hypothetical protein [Bifidobacterium sp. ESL0769]WEV67813.1 hypothetical protein OZX72_02120 [Bifidobacterium sp. ESL0769]